ncbi:MAG: response regulator [Subdoligranulum sp.]|nr:response regulator [Subdoligranulum sp.]
MAHPDKIVRTAEKTPDAVPDTLLIIDDDPVNRAILGRIFSDRYQIMEADRGSRGLVEFLMNRDRIIAVLLDMVMPEMDGITVLRHLNGMGLLKRAPVFLITAEQSTDILQQAYDLGVMDVIGKPIQPYVVSRRVDSVIELFNARRELSSLVESQQTRLQQQVEEIKQLNQSMIEALATAIEFRNQETGGHIQRISAITRFVLENTVFGEGMTAEDIDHITQASVLHDIGKILVPDAILTKPGRFTPEEFQIMKQHTVKGAELLENVPQLKNTPIYNYAYDIALHHHERWDGGGYPEKLRGDEITPWAQVVSLADVYDALSCKRVYKDAFSHATVLEMIISGQCGVFNPALLDCFLVIEPDIHLFYPSPATLSQGQMNAI